MMIKRRISRLLENKLPLIESFASVMIGRKHPIFLDYKVNPIPRYGYKLPPHMILYDIIDNNRDTYSDYLSQFLKYSEYFISISKVTENPTDPQWVNSYLPGLDSVSIYGFLALTNPNKYLEIGSGYSTKFARKAVLDHKLNTKIISIDPNPRAEIDSICDEIIRQPVEDVDIKIFKELEAGDVLFVDNSHLSFTNSDVTVVFLDILPILKSGVIVEFHDRYLPYDYPQLFAKRMYSEQYLLACHLLSGEKKYTIILPNNFIANDPELSKILNPLWENPKMRKVESHGGSFWMKIN